MANSATSWRPTVISGADSVSTTLTTRRRVAARHPGSEKIGHHRPPDGGGNDGVGQRGPQSGSPHEQLLHLA